MNTDGHRLERVANATGVARWVEYSFLKMLSFDIPPLVMSEKGLPPRRTRRARRYEKVGLVGLLQNFVLFVLFVVEFGVVKVRRSIFSKN
jgi:hypothetical protein